MLQKTCFVVSQIGEQDSPERKHADTVLKHIIKPALKDEFIVTRADGMYHSDRIDDKIFENLRDADLVIADLTGENPNVFLEVGFRMALNKPIIYLVQESNRSIPFDIRTINIIHYDLTNAHSLLDSVEKTKNAIQKTIATFSFDATSNKNISQDVTNHELKNILLNISDSLNDLQSKLSIPAEPQALSFNERMVMTAMNEPDKLENLLKLIEKFPHLANQPQ